MKRMGFGLGVASATALIAFGWVAGCHDSVEATASAVCSIVCPCEQPGATADQLVQCISTCETDATTQTLPPACSDCIIQNGDSCGILEATCGAACSNLNQPTGGGSGNASANVIAACSLECSCEFPTGPAGSVSACEASCESGSVTETCATCVNADGTCQATTTCANQCQ